MSCHGGVRRSEEYRFAYRPKTANARRRAACSPPTGDTTDGLMPDGDADCAVAPRLARCRPIRASERNGQMPIVPRAQFARPSCELWAVRLQFSCDKMYMDMGMWGSLSQTATHV